MKTPLHLLAASLLAALGVSAVASNGSSIRSPLASTGADPDAKGYVVSNLASATSAFGIVVEKLAPSTSYQIEVGGNVEAVFNTNSKGAARVIFRTPTTAGPLLDFDPRGKTVRVLSGGQTLLQATLSGAGEPLGAVVAERVFIPIVAGSGATGKARADYRLDAKGRRSFKVELERAGAGPFELFVAGVKRGNFTTVGILAKIKFTAPLSDDPGALPLNFDPRGQLLEVKRNGVVLFSGTLAALARGVNFNPPATTGSGGGTPLPGTPSESEEQLTSTGLDRDASGRARYRVDSSGRIRFDVEIEDVPVGSYTLRIAGVVRGTIRVLSTASGIQGEIEFSTRQDPGELPLTFDPRGQVIEVFNAGGTFFSHRF